MFDLAIPSPLVADWQYALQQCCIATQAQGQLYTPGDNAQQWQATAISTHPLEHHAIIHLFTQNLDQWTPPSVKVRHAPFAQQTLSMGPVWQPDGQLFAVLTLLHPNSQTTVVSAWLSALVGRMGFDVSQHAQQAQQRNETAKATAQPTLQELIDCLDDHVWIKGMDGRYLMINRSLEKAWKKNRSEVVGKDDFAFFSPEQSQRFLEADKLVETTGKQTTIEECHNGDVFSPTWLETIKSPIRGRSGDVIAILGMTRNITRRKTIETQLSLASKMFNNSQEGMIITNRDAHIINVNNAFTQITGYSAEEVIGKNPSLLSSGHQDKHFYQQMWHQLKTKGQWKGEFINRKKGGSVYPQLATISAVMDDKSHLMHYICVFEDISVRKAHEEKLQRMAFYDPLTNLPNRPHLMSLLEQHIEIGEKNQQAFATLFLDIDHFKHINDSMGHFCGDQLLSQLAIRLQENMPLSSHVAHIGGDEFVIILPDVTSNTELMEAINSILSIFQRPFDVASHDSLRISTSIGIALYPRDGHNAETLLKNADTAMYLAKKNGRNGYAFYSPHLTDKSVSHVRIQSALHQAIEKQQLYLKFQPQYHLEHKVIVGVEALLRWQHPQFGCISPADFIPIAEKAGLIQIIGEWVLFQACQQGNAWLAQGLEFGRIAVNVSALQLQQSNFIPRLRTILSETGFPAQRLELEITESFLLLDPQQAIASLNQIRTLGVEIALDDFGTGYSSLSYLKGLPIHKLKIDRSFVRDVPHNCDSNAIVNAIIALGKTLSLTIVAEGIETEEQAKHLVAKACLYGQGYLLSHPVTAEKMLTLYNQTPQIVQPS